MAIVRDTHNSTGGAGYSLTLSHTCTGDKPLLIVGLIVELTGTITSLTYNGVPMVLINSNNNSGNYFKDVRLYRNDTSQTIVSGTAYNIVANVSVLGSIGLYSVSYRGVNQTTPINTNNTSRVTSTSFSNSLTTTINNTWLVGAFYNGSGVSSAGTNTINVNGLLYDSNGARATGTNSLVITNTTSANLVANFAALTPDNTDLPTPFTDLTHYWNLDETSGTSIADSIVGGTTLTAGGTINQTGKNNKGVYCNQTNGTNIYTDTEINNFEKNNPFSYSAWVKRVDTGSILRGFISRVSRASGLLGYNICVNTNNTIYIELFGGSTSNWIQKSSSVAVPTDTTTFHHYVFTYDGSMTAAGVKFYIDGSEIALPTVGGNSLAGASTMKCTARFRIGDYEGGSPNKSIIDEVGSWNRALTSTEIVSLYNSGTGLFYTAPTPSTVNTGFFAFFN